MRAWLFAIAAMLGCGADGTAPPTTRTGATTPRAGAPTAHVEPPPAPPARATVASRLAEIGAAARARLADDFARAGVAYPPSELTLVAIKDEARLEVWARRDAGWAWIADYAVLAASGDAGPKLREGDGQVPEGDYAIDWLNPNSAYHLSMHVDYPNAFDRAQATGDGRTSLGGDIMIHGDAVSIGCLAMGDPAIEELFTLVADTGLWLDAARRVPRVRALLVPTDLRVRAATPSADAPAWTAALYRDLAARLAAFTR